jgi:glycosyltransferase involved in cell wall biosynthesis
MNILFLVQADPFETIAGTEIFVKDLSLELLKLDCNIHILYSSTSHIQQTVCKQNITLHGLTHRRIWLIGGLQYNLKLKGALARLLNKCKFDVVGCHGAGQAYAFSKIKKSNRPLLLYHAHDCMVSEYSCRKNISAKYRLADFFRYKILIGMEESACTHANLIIANSYATREALQESYAVPREKIRTIYLGIPDDYANGFKTIEPEIPTFLHIATNHERKGTRYLLEAMRILREKHQINAKALIVGKKDPYYIHMIEQMGVNASFIDHLPEAMLKKLYASCTCLVVPSLREGFCLPVIEAASFEKPSIVTDTGSLPELVSDRETGFIVNVCDASGLADKMYLVAVDGNLRRKIGANAKKRSQLFKISTIARKTVSTYSSLLLRN